MKILQVIPVFSSSFGGPVTVVRSISKELAKKHKVTVYTTTAKDHNHDFSDVFFEEEVDSYKVIYFPRIFKSSGFNISQAMERALKEIICEYDIIHLHSWRHFQDIIVHHYAKKYGVPYVLQTHGSLPRIIAKQRLKWVYDVFFGYKLLEDASKVIALNQTEAQQCRDMGVSEEKIEIIPNGIDLSEYAELPPKGEFKKKYGIDENEKIVLYLGRIHQSKGLDLLADAFSVVSRDVGNVRLVVVGPDDGYLAIFSRRISDLGIEEKVLLTGFVEKRDKLAALIDSDVFVTPRFYGFPVTFLEACAVGTPIITTTLGDQLEWINNNVGYVTSPTYHDLTKAIYKVISNQKLREYFSNNCKKIVTTEFSINNIVTKLEFLYKEVKNNQV